MTILEYLNKVPIGALLIKKGHLTQEQLDHALAIKEKEGGLLGVILEALGYVSGDIIRQVRTMKQINMVSDLIFKFFVVQIPFALILAFLFGHWLLALIGIPGIIAAAYLARWLWGEKRAIAYIYGILLIILTIVFINITERHIQGHIFPIIIPGLLLLYRNRKVFIATASFSVGYYIIAFLLQNHALIAFREPVSFYKPLVQAGLIVLQSVLFFVLALFLENEWEDLIRLKYSIKDWREKHKREKLRLGDSDVTQIMYLHTIAEGISNASSAINANTSNMSERSGAQFNQVQEITEAIKEVTNFFDSMDKEMSSTSTIAQDTVDIASKGKEEFGHIIDTITKISKISEDTGSTIEKLSQSSQQIGEFTEMIDGIASQTNLLALNAAIEAARAGQEGRGFAVVADEVGKLAESSQKATNEVNVTIKQIQEDIRAAMQWGKAARNETQKGIEVARVAESAFLKIIDQIDQLDQKIHNIVQLSNQQSGYTQMINDNLTAIIEIFSESKTFIQDIVSQISELQLEAENLDRIVNDFKLNEPISEQNARLLKIARNVRQEVLTVIKDKMAAKEITLEELFDRDYQKIPNTDPPKYRTRFDAFLDKYILPIEEKYLEEDSNIAFIVLTDNNGYVPSHIRKYSQPLTGDYQYDLVHSRTKRLFNDRTGLNAARNTKKYLLQTYQRDTGEFMNDLSLPIYINDKHWGAVRIGYTYNKNIIFKENVL